MTGYMRLNKMDDVLLQLCDTKSSGTLPIDISDPHSSHFKASLRHVGALARMVSHLRSDLRCFYPR